jgi:hypothetical protein
MSTATAGTSPPSRAGSRSRWAHSDVPGNAPRHSWRKPTARGRTVDLAALEADLLADEDTQTTVVIGHWTFVGTSWKNDAETTLALATAARAREYDRWRAEQRHNQKSHEKG